MSKTSASLAILGFTLLTSLPAQASSYAVQIFGPDAIFLSGRSDITVPDPSLPWTGPGDYLIRHANPTVLEAKERHPSFIPVTGGDVVKFRDPGIGSGVTYATGFGPFGPSGTGNQGANIAGLGGISGYVGPTAALLGVFLDNNVPSNSGSRPLALDFSAGGLTPDFLTLAPSLNQIFYIGDGVTGGTIYQQFTAPVGATRLYLGFADGYAFQGAPGYYDDNGGSYTVWAGVNTAPVPGPVPVIGALMAFGQSRRIRRRIRNTKIS